MTVDISTPPKYIFSHERANPPPKKEPQKKRFSSHVMKTKAPHEKRPQKHDDVISAESARAFPRRKKKNPFSHSKEFSSGCERANRATQAKLYFILNYILIMPFIFRSVRAAALKDDD